MRTHLESVPLARAAARSQRLPCDAGAWAERLRLDRERADSVLDEHLRDLTETILRRCAAAGGGTVVLIGSTARNCRTPQSDVDFYVVGPRPETRDLPAEVDLCSHDPAKLSRKLREGDDFAQWALRFGLILADTGIAREAVTMISKARLWPDPERKATQAERMLRLAQTLTETGDTDAAREQTATSLGLAARWKLLALGVFPLSDPELADQLDEANESELASTLRSCLKDDSQEESLQAWINVAQRLLGETHRQVRHRRAA